MTSKYKVIIFDWDGTLLDSAACVISAIQDACSELNLDKPNPDEIRKVIGLGLVGALSALCPNVSRRVCLDLKKIAQLNFAESKCKVVKAFDGSKDVLQKLVDMGFILAIATGKGRKGLDKDLEGLGFNDFFTITRCAEESISKPDPAMIVEILEDLDLSPSEALVVGDSTYDVEMANNAGVDALAVTYNSLDAEVFEGMSVVGCLGDIREIFDYLS